MLILAAVMLMIASAIALIGFPFIRETRIWLGFGMYIVALGLLTVEATVGSLAAMSILTFICLAYVVFFLGGLYAGRALN